MFGREDRCIDFLEKFIELSKSGRKIDLIDLSGYSKRCKYLKDLLSELIKNLVLIVQLDDISIDLNEENLIRDVLENNMNIKMAICKMTKKTELNGYARFVYHPVIKLGEKMHILWSIKIEIKRDETYSRRSSNNNIIRCCEIDTQNQNLSNKFREVRLHVAYKKG